MFLIINLMLLLNCSPTNDCDERIVESITSSKLGQVTLGDSFEKISSLYPNALQDKDYIEGSIEEILKTEDSCGAVVFRFNNNRVNKINVNRKTVETTSGIKVGMSIAEVQAKGEKVEEEESLGGELILRLTKCGVMFRLRKENEKEYFDKGGDIDYNLQPNYTIAEFIIRQ